MLFGYEIWQGLYWYFEFLEAYNLGYFEEDIIKKNQIPPPDTGKGILKEPGSVKILFILRCYFDFREYYQLILEDPSKPIVSGGWILFFTGTLKKFS